MGRLAPIAAVVLAALTPLRARSTARKPAVAFGTVPASPLVAGPLAERPAPCALHLDGRQAVAMVRGMGWASAPGRATRRFGRLLDATSPRARRA
jgi:hypothetical protein